MPMNAKEPGDAWLFASDFGAIATCPKKVGLKCARLLAQEDEGAALVADDHVGLAVAIEISRHHFTAHAGFVIDQMGDPLSLARIALELEPIEHRRRTGIDIARGTMRPEAFASDEVEHAVAIHVLEPQRVRLGEQDALRIFLRL